MTRDNENQTLREYGKRKKRYKRIRNMIIAALILVMAVAGIVYLINLNNRSYRNYSLVNSVELKGKSTVGYLSYGSAVIKYGKDGAEAYNKEGNVLWNASYEMMDPVADICGKYVVIADRGNKSVHIFNEKGKAGSYQTDYNIIKVEVASQGVTAVLMQQGDTNYTMLYNVEGNKLPLIANTIDNTGFPMDISLSNDGKKLVSSYLSTKDGGSSMLGFYNFDDVGDNSINNLVGVKFDKGIIIPKVVFLNNNTVCAYKNNGFVLYSMKEKPADIKEVNFKWKINDILYNSNYAGVVLEAKEGTGKRILLYNLKGHKVLDKAIDFEYKKIFLTDKEIIMYDVLTCVIMRINGKVKFKYTFDGIIKEFYPMNNLDQYYLINEAKLSNIQLDK